MEYKKDYFDSGAEYKKSKGLHLIKQKFFSNKNSEEHYNLILKDRWKNFRNCQKTLDLGCGKCEFLKLNPYNIEIFGVDINSKIIKKFKKEGFKIKEGDVNKKIPYPKNFFDGLISSHVLEHIENPTNMFSEIKRILKNHAKLVIIIPNCSFKEFYEDYTHKHPYTKLSLYRLLKDNGFENIKIRNGPCLNQAIGIFFLFPRLRFLIEKIFGEISPSEFIAIADYKK